MDNTLSCIVCATLLGVVLKLAGKYECKLSRIIIINYIVCFAIGIVSSQYQNKAAFSFQWLYFLIPLGTLFILGFNWYAQTIISVGLPIATLFQKMSVVITVLAALTLGDSMSGLQWLGFAIGCIAIFLIFQPSNFKLDTQIKSIVLLFGTIILSSFIEIIFIKIKKDAVVTQQTSLIFSSLIFLVAAIIGISGHLISNKSLKVELKEVYFGLILGIPNFYSIYFMLNSLNSEFKAALFFPILNCSIIILSCLIGFSFFNEKFNIKQWIGLALSLVSISLISYFEK